MGWMANGCKRIILILMEMLAPSNTHHNPVCWLLKIMSKQTINRTLMRLYQKIVIVIGGLLVAFLVASCFIHCPKYLWVESRMERV